MSFKLPKLVNTRCSLAPSVKAVKDVATFDYSNLSNIVEIGRGSFAVVAAARYNSMVSAPKEVVIKKMVDLEEDEKDLFRKEVKLLHTLKHPNIVTFHGMCISPPAIMLESIMLECMESPGGGEMFFCVCLGVGNRRLRNKIIMPNPRPWGYAREYGNRWN